MMRGFEWGDIVRVNLEPVTGQEIRGDARPALVLTTSAFNKLGDVLDAPFTQGDDCARFAGFTVTPYRNGLQNTRGRLINKMRMMDLAARGARTIEQAPQVVIDDTVARLMALWDQNR